MKKRITKSLLLLSMLTTLANADLLVGVDYTVANNENDYTNTKFGNNNGSNDYSSLKLKVGTGDDGGIKAQLFFSSTKYDETLFGSTNYNLNEIGVDLIKEFKVTESFYPFIKIGLTAGYIKFDLSDGYVAADESLAEMSLTLGAGVSYKISEHFYAVGGIDLVGRSFSELEYVDATTNITINDESITSKAVAAYAGLNYQF